MSNAAGIKGFIGLPSLLNASGNDRTPLGQKIETVERISAQLRPAVCRDLIDAATHRGLLHFGS
jgi:signal transduction histidine kinase